MQRHAIYVGGPVDIADEVELFVAARPLWAQLGVAVTDVDTNHRLEGEVHDRQLRATELQRGRIARIAFGDERESAAIVRPRRLQVGERIVGQLLQRVRGELERVQVGEATGKGRQSDRGSVR